MNTKAFQSLVKEIHRVNQGWHCFKLSNWFLGTNDKYLEEYYLKDKNTLQEELINKHSEKIELNTLEYEINPSILIKEAYQFNGYKDACHTRKEKK